MKRADVYFASAEISPQCVENHSPSGVWHEAALRLEPTFRQMLNRLKEQPEGRIVMAIGWKNPPEQPVVNDGFIEEKLPGTNITVGRSKAP